MSHEFGAGWVGEGRPGRGPRDEQMLTCRLGAGRDGERGVVGRERPPGKEAARLCPEMTTPPRETRAQDATGGGHETKAQGAETPPLGQLPLRYVPGAGTGGGPQVRLGPQFLDQWPLSVRVKAEGDLEQRWRPIQEAGECGTWKEPRPQLPRSRQPNSSGRRRQQSRQTRRGCF